VRIPFAIADDLKSRIDFWELMKFECQAYGLKFPSMESGEEQQPCSDGDMTLFNGLLCAAGDERGCQAVKDAQDPVSGEWHRSPRIRVLGYNDRGDASFSPDMALGVQLYLLKTKDTQRAWKWLLWIHNNVACSIELFGRCWLRAIPRLCLNDAPNAGCTMRPGDAAALAATVNYLQRHAGLQDLPDGRLRGHLGSFSGHGPAIAELDSMFNRPGFSQHLTGVSIMVMRMAGLDDPKFASAAKRIAEKNPGNAFFTYINEGRSANVTANVLNRCPSQARPSRRPVNEWQWEREEADKAWERSAYWDCIFMGKLITG